MTDPKTDLKAEFAKTLDLLRRLRDEARTQVHLGGMDAKDRWNKLEPASRTPWARPRGT